MSKKTNSSGSIWTRGPFWFGVLLSVIVIGFGYFSLTRWPVCGEIGPCISNWDQLRFRSSPNEIGDMLAGFAGALAFIWIVVTVLLQAAELREQREQFEKMADAQEAQALLLEKQGKIFEDEQRQRLEAQYDALLHGKLEHLKSHLVRCFNEVYFIGWIFDFEGLHDIKYNRDSQPWMKRDKAEKDMANLSSIEGFYFDISRRVQRKCSSFIRPEDKIGDLKRPASDKICLLSDLITMFADIVEMHSTLSEPAQIKLLTLRIQETLHALKNLEEFFNQLPPEKVSR